MLQKRLHSILLARPEVVYTDDMMVFAEETLTKVTSKKAGPSGDEGAPFVLPFHRPTSFFSRITPLRSSIRERASPSIGLFLIGILS